MGLLIAPRGVFDQRAALAIGVVAPSRVTANQFDTAFFEDICDDIEVLPNTILGWGYGPHTVTRLDDLDQTATILDSAGYDVVLNLSADGDTYTPFCDCVAANSAPHMGNSTTCGQHMAMYTDNDATGHSVPGDRTAEVKNQDAFVFLDENEAARAVNDTFQFLNETTGAGFFCHNDAELDPDGDAVIMMDRELSNNFAAVTTLQPGDTNGDSATVVPRLAYVPQTMSESSYDFDPGGWATIETVFQWLAGNYTGK